ncbi:hypothetical protein [Segniliparus rugosus]|uniref:Uncharacterized protein n=1 Tax=Segniliparus rugosus (strain ATCC BAA-974 / DSM 45345 / CCUG 50838 / CIP 108380 / JCM 13579 / CDC 945) TaxID=679197 RepID=E5XUV8_SEGRC|nr:hypothetical protein [Segniliparus rugosus]EFV11794.1 hypothetical protein HMPREF9336_03280 [Segniliparus rugosus ATCC BAA-974]
MKARWWAISIFVVVLVLGTCGFSGWLALRALETGLQGHGDTPMSRERARWLLPKEITDFRLVSGWYFDGGFHPGTDPRNIHARIRQADVPALDAALTKDEHPRLVFGEPTEIDAHFDLETKAKPTVPAGSVAWGRLGQYGENYFVLCPPSPPQPGDGGFAVDFYYVGEVH